MYQSIFLIALLAQTAETITVTATRTKTRLADTPASVVVLDRSAVLNAPTPDDALRQIPGFALFRRTGSRAANPTSQGVSLRGVGASGASRALVLDDGIPLNDAFGGWVYWGRVPRAALDRVEVVRGGASDLYGSAAMGGVVQFLRRESGVAVDASAGSERTQTLSLFAAQDAGAWRGKIAADLLRSDGYVLVAPEQRGPVDTNADARHAAVDATIERAFGDNARAFVRGAHYAERRDNGTPLQINDTDFRQLALGADAGPLLVRLYGNEQRYHQTFSAVAAGRASERLTADQRVPSRARGGSLQFAHGLGERQAIVAGAEERNVVATDIEGTTRTKGAQRTTAAFVEDSVIVAPSLTVTAALRLDRWRDDEAWSPRISALWRANDRVALTAGAYRAFRAPTLNELLRNFRVGNVLTLANGALGPERLSAVEAGVRFASFRATLFSMTTDDTISNVTLSTTPSLITRQRQNQGSSRSRGLELDADRRLGNDWRLSAGWLFADAALSTGRHTPQVPRNTATLQATWRDSLGLQARWSSRQFDDDLNQFPLRGYTAVDLFASRGLVYAAVENVTNSRIEAGATPVVTLGQPRALRVGLRWTGK
ncbi:MAG TPA: TonB-dependent receptor [Thermoanaerobaculia bacterium]|nr:TonB-dependent receptor [Thermoanaerobaculia bacterium]